MNLKIVTYNLRCPYDYGDGVNSFIHRSGMILDKIAEEKPDVICFQEAVEKSREFFRRNLTDYFLVGHGRDADYTGEGVAIAFRKDTMELYEAQQFWLSPTPYIPASKFDGQSDWARNCVVVTLKHKNIEKAIRFYSVHLDVASDEIRTMGIKQILENVVELEKNVKCHNVILGDFNAHPDSGTIEFCNNYSEYKIVDVTEKFEYTFHNYGKNVKDNTATKIDYIYMDKELSEKVTDVYLWDDEKNGVYLSDHYPICCNIDLK